MKFGQRGIAIIASICHLIAYIVIAVHPPYPVLVVIFMLAGFGNGLADAAWNAWMGNMANPNEVLGFLHAFYGMGAVIAPLVATSMITKGALEWYCFYYVMVCFPIPIPISSHPLSTHSSNRTTKHPHQSLPQDEISNTPLPTDQHGSHRTRHLDNSLLDRHRRRLPRSQSPHLRHKRQPYERSTDPAPLRACHLALCFFPAGLRGHRSRARRLDSQVHA